jgi:CHASE3 domain sensor protein
MERHAPEINGFSDFRAFRVGSLRPKWSRSLPKLRPSGAIPAVRSVHRRPAAALLAFLAGAARRIGTSGGSTATGTWLCYDHPSPRAKDGATKMIRKIAMRSAVAALFVLMALNAYLAIHRLSQIRKSAAFTMGSSIIQADISGVLQDLTDMETGQRGYLLTGDPAYLKPYAEGKTRIESHFASLRSGLADRTERERSLESRLESGTGSKQAEMERSISLRQQGYRRRAFNLVDTNEGRDYMDGARNLVALLSSAESSSFARFDKERAAGLSKALSETIIANSCLLVLAACLFGFIRYHEYVLEKDTAESRQALAVRDSQLERLTSALSNQARSKIAAIEANARLLLEEYGGFLPRHGHECAEQIKEAAAQMERLRQELLDPPGFNQTDQKAA